MGCLDGNTNATSSTPYHLDSLVLPATSLYTGINDDTLKINGIPRSFDRYQYRVKVQTINYACDDGTFSDAAEVVVFLDNDGDGVGTPTTLTTTMTVSSIRRKETQPMTLITTVSLTG
ncbi:MAG: hypothetical protein CM15mP75_2970 [Flammeovirgaceae bacterium]|nr:MAG: hypothetical protein CM15mP75_2970 [Flammeovirgaceae bacterium]